MLIPNVGNSAAMNALSNRCLVSQADSGSCSYVWSIDSPANHREVVGVADVRKNDATSIVHTFSTICAKLTAIGLGADQSISLSTP